MISAIEALPTLEADLRQWRQVVQPTAVRSAGAIVAGDNPVLSGARLLAVLAEAAKLPPGDARVWQFRFRTRPDQRQSPEATKPAQ